MVADAGACRVDGCARVLQDGAGGFWGAPEPLLVLPARSGFQFMLRAALPVVVSCSALLAQATWSQVFPAPSPSPRVGATMACFEPTGDVWMLFGVAPAGDSLGWRLSGGTWSTVATPVPELYGARMVFDSTRQRLVVFGGSLPGQGVSNEVYEWDGSSWSNPNPVVKPTPRGGHAMAFDRSRGVTVLYGGIFLPGLSGSIQIGLQDVWEWDGTSWTPRGVAPFGARSDALMAFDPVRQDVLLFGGSAPFPGTATFNDSWSWNGLAWSQRTPATQPTIRRDAAMTTDLARARVVLLGGNADPNAWEWNGSDWDRRIVISPTPRRSHCMAWDPVLRRVVVFGGQDLASTYLGDTWVYRTASPADVAPFGSGCVGSAGVPSLTNAPYVLPWIGDTMRTRVLHVPAASVGGVFVSSFGAAAPVSLASVGMPGCDLLLPVDVAEFRVATASLLEWSLAVPNAPALVGVVFRQQAFVVDGPANPLGLTASNAITATLGLR